MYQERKTRQAKTSSSRLEFMMKQLTKENGLKLYM